MIDYSILVDWIMFPKQWSSGQKSGLSMIIFYAIFAASYVVVQSRYTSYSLVQQLTVDRKHLNAAGQ